MGTYDITMWSTHRVDGCVCAFCRKDLNWSVRNQQHNGQLVDIPDGMCEPQSGPLKHQLVKVGCLAKAESQAKAANIQARAANLPGGMAAWLPNPIKAPTPAEEDAYKLDLQRAALSRRSGPCRCTRCSTVNEYAEPNQKDGSYICFNCR